MKSEEQKKNRLARFTLEKACDAVVWHGPDARFTEANPAACRLFGYSKEEMLTLTVQDVAPSSTKASFKKAWKEVKEKGILHVEDDMKTKDGALVPVEVKINFIEFEGQEYVCSFIRDISARKKTEQERECAFNEIKRLRAQLEMENEYLQEELKGLGSFGNIVGTSPPLQTILRQIEMVAATDACVLIAGESGTGKELIAHEIHQRSLRKQRPMIRVNCASIPRDLYESEFFGHVRGAFTGAVKDRAGRFELADGGTLFLDEIGEIPLDLQSKLLRVLQEGTFEKVGDEKTRKVDVRIITATNRDLKKEVEAGRFREDLYYRLNVFPIEVPPLRKRKEDIPLLADYFLGQSATRLQLAKPRMSKADAMRLKDYDWPGNIRELQNVLERAVITSRSGKFRLDFQKTGSGRERGLQQVGSVESQPEKIWTYNQLKDFEKKNILTVLKKTGGKVFGPGGAAELLDMPPTTLASKLKRLGLKKRYVQPGE